MKTSNVRDLGDHETIMVSRFFWIAFAKGKVVELRGIEPLTFALPVRRSPS